MNKRVLVIVFLLLITLAVPLTLRELQKQQEIRSRAAGEAIEFSFVPNTLTKQVGDNVDVQIVLDGKTNNVSAVDIIISFDTSLVDVTGFTPTAVFNTQLINKPDNQAGTVRYAAGNLTLTPIAGVTNLGTLSFKTKVPGIATISFQKTQVASSGGTSDLPVTPPTPDSYTITAATSPTPSPTPTSPPSAPTATPTPISLTPIPTPLSCIKSNPTNEFSGTVYNDVDRDGQYDQSPPQKKPFTDQPLNGWTIGLKNSSGQIIATTTSNQAGSYAFRNVCDGTYKLNEEMQSGWTVVEPIGNEYTLTISNGQGFTYVDFGNVQNTIPTVTPSQPTLTPTPISILPTPTFIPGGMQLEISLQLSAIGGSGENTNPFTTQKILTVELFNVINNTDQPVLSKTGYIMFDPQQKVFTGIIDLGTSVTQGDYYLKVKTDKYLKKRIPGIVSLTPGAKITVSPVKLSTGDINNDNKIDIRDYNIIVSCFEDKAATSSCGNNKQLADLDDNGTIDGVDYNILIKSLSAREGD